MLKKTKLQTLNIKIKQISCGFYNTFIFTENNELFACGSNTNGESGLGNISHAYHIENVHIKGEIKEIICGRMHTFILMENNELFASGSNKYGQLGLGSKINKINEFQKIEIQGKIKQISCGEYYTFILMENNDLFASGLNTDGQLGLNSNDKQINEFQKVSIEGKIKQVSCGLSFTFILMENDEIFSSGDNSRGQLGFGYNSNIRQIDEFKKVSMDGIDGKIKKISCGFSHIFILMENNEIFASGSYGSGELGFWPSINTFQKVPINGEIKQIICGSNCTFILMENNVLFASGNNKEGQFGLGPNIYQINQFQKIEIEGEIKQISCRGYHVFILMENDDIFASGNNTFGQLGLGHTIRDKHFHKIEIPTPLHIACKTGNIDNVKFLIQEYDINKKINGDSPLDIAIKNNHLNIVELLINNGADITKIILENSDISKANNILRVVQFI